MLSSPSAATLVRYGDQDAYSLLRPTRYRFKRQRVVTSGIDDLWDADLADVSNLAPNESTGIINLPLQSLFSHIDVYMNNKLVSVGANFPWKANFKVILSSGSDEQKSQLQSQLFIKDDSPMDSLTLNTGFVKRYQYTQKSRVVELEGNLLADCLILDKYLINGIDIYMKLFRSSAPFFVDVF